MYLFYSCAVLFMKSFASNSFPLFKSLSSILMQRFRLESNHNHLYCLKSLDGSISRITFRQEHQTGTFIITVSLPPSCNISSISQIGFQTIFLNKVQEKQWKFDSFRRVWHFPQSDTTFAVPRQNLSISMEHCIGGKTWARHFHYVITWFYFE